MYISIIEDEPVLCKRIKKKLEKVWYTANAFSWFRDFMVNGDDTAHLYIVDLFLTDGTGFDIIKWLRDTKKSLVPIIVISGFGDSENIVYALNIGADDYMTKPFVPDELIARIKALLRRPLTFHPDIKLYYGDMIYDVFGRTVRLRGEDIFLTKKESQMLELFISNVGKVVSRERLVSHVWWQNKLEQVTDNTINVSLAWLKKRFGSALPIVAVYGHGYILEQHVPLSSDILDPAVDTDTL